MSIPNMITALVDNNKLEAESAFKSVISQKVGSAIDLKRVQVANALVKQHVSTDDVEVESEEV
tara:strand:- start:890 stop:1078 length:189 start_codon:yes stop_codon:yes gene_type:complete